VTPKSLGVLCCKIVSSFHLFHIVDDRRICEVSKIRHSSLSIIESYLIITFNLAGFIKLCRMDSGEWQDVEKAYIS
jgi:hypothetical protein